MIRSYSVRIHRHIYNIDEDAYECLQKYYQSIHSLNVEEKIKQVFIYELDQYVDQKLYKITSPLPTPVVTLQMVEEILSPIFHPEETQITKPRKNYYRLTQKKLIAGVCTGFAAYFQTSVTRIRILFLFLSLLAGLGVLIYIFIAMNTHVAQNVVEVLQAYGRPVTITNMLQIITENQFEYKKSRFPHLHIIPIKPSVQFKKLFLSFIRYTIGTIILFFMVFLAVSAFYVLFYEFKNNLSYHIFNALYPSWLISEFVHILLTVLITSIILITLYHTLRLFFPDMKFLFVKNTGKFFLYGSSLFLTILVVYTLVEFSDSEQIQQQAHIHKAKMIELDILDKDTINHSSWPGLLFLQKPYVTFSQSPNDSVLVFVIFHAHGKYSTEAMDYCKNITYDYQVQSNKINLSSYWTTQKRKYRLQRVTVHIQIPENVQISLSKKFVQHFYQLNLHEKKHIQFAFNAESFKNMLFENK